MKKRLYLISTILLSAAALTLSSCLKDNRYVDFSKVGTIVEFPLGGAVNFGNDAITATPDTDANGTIVQQFAVNISSPTAPTTATTVTFSVDDPTIVTAYDASNTAVNYLPMPSNAYVFTQTSITIPAGQRVGILTVTFYKNLLDPSKSYMLPIAIKSAGGYTISGNQGIHYYHFIGNDFAGTYSWDYTRTPAAGNFTGGTATLSPITPTEFSAFSGYYTGLVQYDVSFTKTGNGASAVYTNFSVVLDPASVAAQLTANKISVTSGAVFKSSGTASLPGPYTFAQAKTLFDFQYSVLGPSGTRVVEDRFY